MALEKKHEFTSDKLGHEGLSDMQKRADAVMKTYLNSPEWHLAGQPQMRFNQDYTKLTLSIYYYEKDPTQSSSLSFEQVREKFDNWEKVFRYRKDIGRIFTIDGKSEGEKLRFSGDPVFEDSWTYAKVYQIQDDVISLASEIEDEGHFLEDLKRDYFVHGAVFIEAATDEEIAGKHFAIG